ncbi:transposase [Lactobacillus colini]|uniref:Transposase n=1 Tax=Lactobacillus colini TaxID=1819254 RepID=A0ABS4MCM8_9LACO|nr:IS110 family transposase [Lactobacillus colini]MBP2057438.1 transposase [Lactobacillus colini]
MNNVIFGIDVSSRDSSVCEFVGQAKNEFKITNDTPGFTQLLKELQLFAKKPQIIFESTGVYSRRLQAFLDDYDYQYVIMNPLTAKKEMNQGLRYNKTDKNDACHLAMIQLQNHHPFFKKEAEAYHKMQSLDRSYDELTHDIVSAKNRLHRILQLTFPEIETLFNIARGENYWQIVKLYPHCQIVRNLNKDNIINDLLKIKSIGQKRAQKMADKLIDLANKAYPAASQDSPETSDAVYYADRLLQLTADRNERLEKMIFLAQTLKTDDLEILVSIPGFAKTTAVRVLAELGNIRRFKNPNKIDAFIGIDPGRYQSGQIDSHLGISKHGNAIARKVLYRAIGQIAQAAQFSPCHIAEYYAKKKSSQTKGFKKIAIASVHKLVRTIYALIINNQLYDYEVAKQNQRRKS